MDTIACNYDENATDDDGSCIYAEANADCNSGCLEGYTPLTLTWTGADQSTSFIVVNLDEEELSAQTLAAVDGSMTQCWETDLQADCFTIDIVGPDALTWSISSPISESPFLSGTNDGTTFGVLCAYGCMDLAACNYDELVNVDDGSCWYPIEGFDCDSNSSIQESR